MLSVLLTIASIGCVESRRPCLVVVRTPSASAAEFKDPDGVLGRRFADRVRDAGWLLRPEELSPSEATALDAWTTPSRDLTVIGAGKEEHAVYLGPNEGGVWVRARGRFAGESGTPWSRLAEESRAWVDRGERLRWEEVVEFADLPPEGNEALRNLPAEAGDWAEVKRAFLRDKRVANLALYLLATRALERSHSAWNCRRHAAG
ncbi:MAG: hypothetical protein U0527_13265 [Candidatus Eisenbacteria bacterium]